MAAAPPTSLHKFEGEVEITSNLSVATNAFFVDANTNRVGIGSTIPTTTLDIPSTLSITSLKIGNITNAHVPTGIIIMWSGGSVPTGWVLCNGSNGTPDLRDKFIMPAGSSYNVGATGGSHNVTLTNTHMPAHTHTSLTFNNNNNHSHSGNTNNSGNHGHTLYATRDSYGNGDRINGQDTGGNDEQVYYGKDAGGTSNTGGHSHNRGVNNTGSHSHSYTTANAGSGSAFSILPPYYTLAFIMKQ